MESVSQWKKWYLVPKLKNRNRQEIKNPGEKMKIYLYETALFKQDIKLPKCHLEISDTLEKFVSMKWVNYKSRCKRKKKKGLFVLIKTLKRSHKYMMEQIHPWLTCYWVSAKEESQLKRNTVKSHFTNPKREINQFYLLPHIMSVFLAVAVINRFVTVTSQP